jgi:hypothetical protein
LEDLTNTYVETKDIGGVNYISEGFLTRYSFTLKQKGGFFKILSTVLSAIATIASFIPGIGNLVALGANAANFIISTAVTGKFQTAAFLSTLLSVGGAAASKVGSKFIGKIIEKTAEGAKAAKWAKTAEKLTKVAKDL